MRRASQRPYPLFSSGRGINAHPERGADGESEIRRSRHRVELRAVLNEERGEWGRAGGEGAIEKMTRISLIRFDLEAAFCDDCTARSPLPSETALQGGSSLRVVLCVPELTRSRQLLYLAKNYPGKPIEKKLHTCFSQFIGGDEAKVLDGIKKAEYIKKELEMLYYIKKYRAMKSAYSKGVEW